MTNNLNHDATRIDPDPFSIAALVFAAGSFVLQFIQTTHDLKTSPSRPARPAKTRLMHLEKEIRNFRDYLDRILRAIDRGSPEPEAQFYNLPFRIGYGSLFLEREWHGELTKNLHQAYTNVGAISLWVNQIIANDPSTASFIGAELLHNLSETTSRLNELIALGGTNRQIIAEVRYTLEAFEKVLSQLLNSN